MMASEWYQRKNGGWMRDVGILQLSVWGTSIPKNFWWSVSSPDRTFAYCEDKPTGSPEAAQRNAEDKAAELARAILRDLDRL